MFLEMKTQHKLNEESADKADLRTRALYHDISSPAAEVEQLKQAGLSPALLYAKGGVGGSTPSGAQAAGTSMGNYPDIMGSLLSISQMKNINADTQKKKAEINEINSRTKQIDQNIINMLSDKNLTDAKVAYQNLLNKLTEYDIKFKDATISTDIEKRKVELAKMVEDYRTAVANAGSAEIRLQIEDATAGAKIKQEMQKVTLNDLQAQAAKENIKLTDKQIEMIQQNIIEKHLTNAWIDIKNEQDIAKVKNDIEMELKRMNMAEDQQTYDMCMGVVDRFLNFIKPSKK